MLDRVQARRRPVLRMLATLGFAPACVLDPDGGNDDDDVLPEWPEGPWNQPPDDPAPDPNDAADRNVHALMDVLIPAEFDDVGALVSPGALEVGAPDVLALSTFIPAAQALALLPEVSVGGYDDLERFDAVVKGIVSADLDALAFDLHPLTPFRDLTRTEQEHAVHEGMADPLVRPLLQLVRAACFIAFLGAVHTDQGLVAVGFPPFEDWDDRLASSGYPRTLDGRLVDAETEDLAQLAADGELDDYTFNEAPAPTEGDDLSGVIDAAGDLY